MPSPRNNLQKSGWCYDRHIFEGLEIKQIRVTSDQMSRRAVDCDFEKNVVLRITAVSNSTADVNRLDQRCQSPKLIKAHLLRNIWFELRPHYDVKELSELSFGRQDLPQPQRCSHCRRSDDRGKINWLMMTLVSMTTR